MVDAALCGAGIVEGIVEIVGIDREMIFQADKLACFDKVGLEIPQTKVAVVGRDIVVGLG